MAVLLPCLVLVALHGGARGEEARPPAAPARAVAVHALETAQGTFVAAPPLFWNGSGASDALGHPFPWPAVEAMASVTPPGRACVEGFRQARADRRRRNRIAAWGAAAGGAAGVGIAIGGFYATMYGDVDVPPLVFLGAGTAVALVSAGAAGSIRRPPPAPTCVLLAAMDALAAAPAAPPAPPPATGP